MKFLIEGERYPIDLLRDVFSDPKFYLQEGNYGTVVSVGYYHNHSKNLIAFLLPKVFMGVGGLTVFGLSSIDLFDFEQIESFKHKNEYLWLRQLSIYFYSSLLEFKKRSKNTSILNTSLSYNLNSKFTPHNPQFDHNHCQILSPPPPSHQATQDPQSDPVQPYHELQ